MQKRKRVNPFYVLLVVAGLAFSLTACAYGVMAVRQLHAANSLSSLSSSSTGTSPAEQAEVPFVQFLDKNGVQIMIWEVGILAVATALAIGTDSYWSDESNEES